MNFARIFWTVCSLTAASCVVLASAWLYSPVADAGSAVFASPESNFVAAINEYRAQAGVQPLQMDTTMAASAAEWTSHMVAGSFLGHANPQDIKASPPVPAAKSGENVGRGRTVGSLVEAFIQSPTHRSNILDPDFTHIGVGVEIHPSSGQMYTTHRFAALAPASVPPAPVPSAPVTPEAPPVVPPEAPAPPEAPPVVPPEPPVTPEAPPVVPPEPPVTPEAPPVVPPEAPAPPEAASAESAPEAASQPRGSRRLDGPATDAGSAPDDRATPDGGRGSRRAETTG